jgi:hypothetical protein
MPQGLLVSTLPQVRIRPAPHAPHPSASSSCTSAVSRRLISHSTARRAERGPSPGRRDSGGSASRSLAMPWRRQIGPRILERQSPPCASSSWEPPISPCRRSIALVEAGHEVVAAYSQPPRPGGRRGKELSPPPSSAAEALGHSEVRHPASPEGRRGAGRFAALDADIAVVAAYGLILPQAVLDAPKHGCLNLHASLLPRWRGAAPIQRAILAGDAETGVGIMQMEAGLDTGPMLAGRPHADRRKTAGELTAELAEIGARLMVQVLADLAAYPASPSPRRA